MAPYSLIIMFTRRPSSTSSSSFSRLLHHLPHHLNSSTSSLALKSSSLLYFFSFLFFLSSLSSVSLADELPEIVLGPQKLVALAGTNVTLSCATAPNTNDSEAVQLSLLISWQRNGQSIALSKHRQTLEHIPGNGSVSRLHLDHVSELDEGVYQCTARNDLGLDVSRPARLTVQSGAKITGGQRLVYNVTAGTKVPIECDARGQPPPRIELLIGERSLLEADREHFSNVFLQFNATSSVNITCRASNYVTPLNRTVEEVRLYEIYVQAAEEGEESARSVEMDVEAEEAEAEAERRRQEEKSRLPSGYCSPYVGTGPCRAHIPRNSLVFHNLSDATDYGKDVNEEIVAALWTELIVSLQEPCRGAAEKLICYYAFPQCSWAKGFPQSKPLCREDCIAVRDSQCVREWALLEDNRQRGIFFKSRGHFRLPECELLPSSLQLLSSNQSSTPFINNISSSSPQQHFPINPDTALCSHAELTAFRPAEATTECVRGRGRFYQGQVNVTKHGIGCQRWDRQTPHAHIRPPPVYPEIWGAENYCRNAGGEEPMPWCYTEDPLVRWQHCDIPLCEDQQQQQQNLNNNSSVLSHSNLYDQRAKKFFEEEEGQEKLKSSTTSTSSSTTFELYERALRLLRRPLSALISSSSSPNSVQSGPKASLPHPLALSVGVAALLLLAIATTLSLLCLLSVRALCRQSAIYSQTMSAIGSSAGTFPGISGDSEFLDLSKLPSNCAYHCMEAVKVNPQLEALEYARNRIVYIRDIGCGAFGRVFMAKAPGLLSVMTGDKNGSKKEAEGLSGGGGGDTIVAVKVLREEATEEQVANFEREATLMASFEHPNVVRLLGVCAIGRPLCLLVEYMGRGDLNSFLRSLGPANYVICLPHLGAEDSFLDGRGGGGRGGGGNSNSLNSSSGSGRKNLTDADLVNLARQVAAGMTYLAEKGYVHCDLATRNCLVNADLVVKISDFGLSQRLTAGGANYYRADVEKDALPIRWMPLEAILFGRFTPASDIWAFGVLLWEVFSYALQPYYGLTHEQVIAYLKDGNLLTPPSDGCPPAVYALMRTCWAAEPAARPAFRALEASLADLHRSLKEEEEEAAAVVERFGEEEGPLLLVSPSNDSSVAAGGGGGAGGAGDALSLSARSTATEITVRSLIDA